MNYIIVKYDNETVMVPAWVYYRSKQTDGIGVKFAVNALDGSVVHFDFNFDSYIRWFR